MKKLLQLLDKLFPRYKPELNCRIATLPDLTLEEIDRLRVMYREKLNTITHPELRRQILTQLSNLNDKEYLILTDPTAITVIGEVREHK